MHADCDELTIGDDTLNEMVACGVSEIGCPDCGEALRRQTGQVWKCANCGKPYILELGPRDPRTDPQCGDVLAVDHDAREVVARLQDSAVEYGFPNKAATRVLNLLQWQIWARKADVLKVAP